VPKTTPVVLELSHDAPLEGHVRAPGLPANEAIDPSNPDEQVEAAPLNRP
jgi:hypothetical protein